jgi:hypothetical protein
MDKDSTEYFMTKMTQEEFNERVAGKQIQHYSFNHIQPERSKREDLVYIEPDFEKMKVENPCLYSKYEVAQEALRCGALNFSES